MMRDDLIYDLAVLRDAINHLTETIRMKGLAMSDPDVLVRWLNDAYAMEKALVPILEDHAKDAENYPELQSRIQQHARRSEQHAELVKGCIEQLGGSTSAIKVGRGKLFGTMQSMTTEVNQHEVVKNALADFASENFEIASYTALITAAEEAGEQRIAEVCREILQDERAMASWIYDHLPVVARHAVRRQEQE